MSSPSPDERPVLVVSGGHTTRALWTHLGAHYDLVFPMPQVAQAAQEMGIPSGHLGQLVDGDVAEAANNAAALLSARAVAASPVLAGRLADAYNSDAPPALAQAGNWWHGFVQQILADQVTRLAALERLAAVKRVAGVVVHEDVSPEHRALVNWANAKGIPAVHVPHAACHLHPGVTDIHREWRAPYVAASGAYEAEFFRAAGAPHVEMVGDLNCDYLYETHLPTKAEARTILRIPEWGDTSGQPWLLYGTTWGQTTSLRSRFEDEFEETLDAVLALAKAWRAILIINLHPNENPANEKAYVDAVQDAHVNGGVTRVHKIFCMAASDLVIKHGPSNFCLETAIMGVPSCYVVTDDFDFQNPVNLPPRGPVSELPIIARQALGLAGAAQWDEFIRFYNAAHPHGGAAEKCAAWINSLCN